MILKVYNQNPVHYSFGGWAYFDQVEELQVWAGGNKPEKPEIPIPIREDGRTIDPPLEGIFTNMDHPHCIARVWRTRANEQTCFDIAYREAYLLGDDGKTIERL